jgi:DNA polymerase-3 subunit epsilon
MNHPFIVFDFETTGLSPAMGDRAIEIGAVCVSNGKIIDQFQSLMNPGKRIPSFIESYTGITNSMIARAPSSEEAMKRFSLFIKDRPLVAHNASFDLSFLKAEFERINLQVVRPIACSLKVARRLYQNAPNHKLATLVKLNQIKTNGLFHRALADAEMTAYLWIKMSQDIGLSFNINNVNFNLMHKLGSIPKKNLEKFMTAFKESEREMHPGPSH